MNRRQARVAVVLGFTLATFACGGSGLTSDGPHDVLPNVYETPVYAPYNPAFPNDEIANTPDAEQDLVRADLALISYFGDGRDFWALADSPRVPECADGERSEECDVAMLQKLAILYRAAGLPLASRLLSSMALDEANDAATADPLQLAWAAGGHERTVAALFGLSRGARAATSATYAPPDMRETIALTRAPLPCSGFGEALAMAAPDAQDAIAYASAPPECRSTCERATDAASTPWAQRSSHLVATCGPSFFGVQDGTAASMFAVSPYSVPLIRSIQFAGTFVARIRGRGDRLAATFDGALLEHVFGDVHLLRVPAHWPATFTAADESVALATSVAAPQSLPARVYVYATPSALGVGATPWIALGQNGETALGGNALPGIPSAPDALGTAFEGALTVVGCAPPLRGEAIDDEVSPPDTRDGIFALIAATGLSAARVAEVANAMDVARFRDPCAPGGPFRGDIALVVSTSTHEGMITLSGSVTRPDATVDGRGAGTIRIGNGPARPLTAANVRALHADEEPIVRFQMAPTATVQDLVALADRVGSLGREGLLGAMRVSISTQ